MPTISTTTWIWIGAVLGGLLVAWLIAFLVILALAKKAQKKAFSSLDALVPYEKERFQAINDVVSTLIVEKRLPKSGDIADLVDEQKSSLASSRIDMAKVKASDDFLILYLRKLIKEKGLKMKEPYSDLDKKMASYFYEDSQAKDSPYRVYNNQAMRYNSYLGMMVISGYVTRKGYPKAPVL
ncbi:MAG: hypothetical protein LKM30_01420 [Bacilli bacterium]|jgi:hypothetical protein|nr:hypothetical protein [Bacilli bacterium]